MTRITTAFLVAGLHHVLLIAQATAHVCLLYPSSEGKHAGFEFTVWDPSPIDLHHGALGYQVVVIGCM